jgi:archaellum biogenesis ATPase FlaH
MSDGLRVISAALSASSASALIAMPQDMFLDNERTVLDFVRTHYRQYRELPEARTVQEETGVRLPAANETLAFYVDRMYERHEYNQIRDRFAGLRDGLASMNMQAVAASVADMHRVTRQRVRRGLESVNLREASELVVQRLNATRGYGGVTGIETGWPGYDQITGGYQNGDLISLVGRPSLGKTYLLLRQAWYAHVAGSSVLFVTTEMGAEQIGRRHVSIALGINPTHLKMNTVSTYTERRISQFYRDMIGVDRFRIFSVGMNSQLSAVEAFIQEFDPDLIVIDGVYLMRPNQGARNASRTERITAVFDELKALTLETNKPFLVSTQFNRAAGKGGAEGSLENIGYTDAIGTHSSVIVAARHGPTTNPKASRWLQFLKGREGEEGRVAINFKFAPLDMDEFTPVEEQDADGTPGAVAANVNWMA